MNFIGLPERFPLQGGVVEISTMPPPENGAGFSVRKKQNQTGNNPRPKI